MKLGCRTQGRRLCSSKRGLQTDISWWPLTTESRPSQLQSCISPDTHCRQMHIKGQEAQPASPVVPVS